MRRPLLAALVARIFSPPTLTAAVRFRLQVKTNATSFSFWLMGEHTKEYVSDSNIYVFVNLKDTGTEFFVVPSKVVARKVISGKSPHSIWHSFMREDAVPYKDNWPLLSKRK